MTQEAVPARTPLHPRSWLPPAAELRRDFIAGLTVAAISLPQSMAYALIAGVDPRFGLFTAIIFTAVAGLLGSSRHLVNGPTGAVSLVVFGALAFIDPDAKLDAYEAMFLLAVLVGSVQILIAVLRLGDVTRYISESVVTGFIIGAASLTIIGQAANALGVKAQGSGHDHVLHRFYLTVFQAAPFNWKAVAISVSAVVLAVGLKRLVRRFRLPQVDMLLAVIVLSVGAYLAGWSRAAPGARAAVSLIEAVPAAVPSPHIPDVKPGWLLDLSSSAVAIGILGLLEALAIAKAIAHKSRQALDYNRQCLAEGVGNLVGGFFRCMPGAGSLSRTAINYQAGAVSRLSGVFTAATVAVAVLLLAPLAAYIPKAALAGLLIVAAARLFDRERLRYILAASRHDAIVLVATALAAVVIGVEFAILVGSALSITWYLLKASRLKVQELVVSSDNVVRARIPGDPPAEGALILDIEGDLFFGAKPDLEVILEDGARRARDQGIGFLVVRLKRVRNPDAVALEALDVFLAGSRQRGLTVLLAGVRPDLQAALVRIGITRRHDESLLFEEEEKDYSATLAAVRHALALARRGDRAPSTAAEQGLQPAYYLV